MENDKVYLSLEKCKRILKASWHLISESSQREIISAKDTIYIPLSECKQIIKANANLLSESSREKLISSGAFLQNDLE